MKKTWKFIMTCVAIACASLVLGCSDDDTNSNGDDTEINNPVEPNPEEPEGSLKDPEKAKEKLNTVGKELVAMVDADDFKDLTTVANALSKLLEEDDYVNEEPGYGAYAQKILSAARGNMGALYTMPRVTHQASEYYGTYEYANGEWTWTENPSLGKFVAKFPAEGKDAIITATCSGSETDFIYDGETFKIPAKAEASIVWNSNTLAKVEVATANLGTTSPYKADVDAKVTIGKYIVTAFVRANSTEVTANSKITIDGKEAVIGKAVVGGQNITADSDLEFEERVNTAEGQAIILDDAYITIKCDDVKSFAAVLDEDDEYTSETWKPLTKDEQIAKVEANNKKQHDKATGDATDYAKYLKGDLRFKSQKEASATLGFQPYKDYSYEAFWEEYKLNGDGNYEWVRSHPLGIDWEYWEVEAVAVFSDGSKMSFDNLDSDNSPLKGFINSLEDLIDSFGKLLE